MVRFEYIIIKDNNIDVADKCDMKKRTKIKDIHKNGSNAEMQNTSVRVPRKAKIVLPLAKIFFLYKNTFK